MNLNHIHDREMIEMSQCDSFKPTFIKLPSIKPAPVWSTPPLLVLHPKWTPKLLVLSRISTSGRLCAKTLWISCLGLSPPLPPPEQNLPAFLQVRQPVWSDIKVRSSPISSWKLWTQILSVTPVMSQKFKITPKLT